MTGGINVAQTAALSPPTGQGGVWRGPLGTTLPTDTTSNLDAGFISLGYIDDDGVTRHEDRPNTPQFAWGGAKVATLQQHYDVTFTMKLMQPIDPDVLKAVHSDSNVSVAAATSDTGTITTTLLNPKQNVNSAWVIAGFYQLATMRLAIPIARITTINPVKWTHKTLALYDVTLSAFPDTSGNFVYQITDDGIFSA